MSETGLKPVALESGAMTFEQARLTLDCRKLFKSPMTEASFIDKSILEKWYGNQPGGSLHDVYVVEIEGVAVGAKVKIAFALDGREWTDPKTDQVKCFCDLTAIRLETLEPGAAPLAPAEAKGTIHEPEDGDIPF